jgi:hypothetical protein
MLALDAAVHLHMVDAAVVVDKDGAGESGVSAVGGGVGDEAEVSEGHGSEAVGGEAGVGDEGKAGPVEIDAAEPTAFGDEGGEGGGRLVEGVGLGIGGEGGVEGVGGTELVGEGCFGDGLPAEWVDEVWVGVYTEDGGAVVVGGLGESEGFLALDGAEAPEGDDAGEGGDCPATSAEGLAACADFAADETEEDGGDESGEEEEQDDGLDDGDDGGGVPAGVEGEKGADAVVVGVVEEDVAEEGDEGEEIEARPVDRCGGGCLRAMGIAGLLAIQEQAVGEPEEADDCCGFEGDAEEGVGDASMVLEDGDGALEGPEDVDVGKLGGDGHGGGGVGGFAVEAGAGEDGSGHDVGERVHWVPAY